MPKRKCKQCSEFVPSESGIKLPGGFFCSYSHATTYARDKAQKAREKKAKADHRKAKERVKTRGEWLKDAQKWFNKYIRLRDAGQPCISCGRHHQGQYHAGHYRTVGAAPELRFNEINCHIQCAPCNNHLSGNIVNYRPRLIEKIGQDQVDWLEGGHKPLKLSLDDIKCIINTYRHKCKVIENDRD